ncbi:hypothetical protein D3C84_908960 [compost metagenome]
MRGPGRGGDQVALDVGLVHGNLHVAATGQLHFRPAGRVGAAFAAVEHTGGGQQLGAMAHRGDRLVGRIEGLHQGQHLGIQAQVFRGAAAGNQQGVVSVGPDLAEVEVQGEVVPWLLTVGLVAFEIVDGGAHRLAGALARADRMHAVAHHLQGLERHHHFVVFDVVADQHQNLFRSHERSPVTG